MLLVTVSVLRVCLLVKATYFSYVVVVVVVVVGVGVGVGAVSSHVPMSLFPICRDEGVPRQ